MMRSTSQSRIRVLLTSGVVAGALVLAGCNGGGEEPTDDPTTEEPATEEPTTEEPTTEEPTTEEPTTEEPTTEEPEPELEQFGPGDTVEGAESDDPWEGTLVIDETTYIVLDVQNDGRREPARQIEVFDEAGKEIAFSESRQQMLDTGYNYDAVAVLHLEPGEYLVVVGESRRGELVDFTMNAYVPPEVSVGDDVDFNIRPGGEQRDNPLEDGELFGIHLPEDGPYTFRITGADDRTEVNVYSTADQAMTQGLISSDRWGLIESEEFESGYYIIQTVQQDALEVTGTLEIRAG